MKNGDYIYPRVISPTVWFILHVKTKSHFFLFIQSKRYSNTTLLKFINFIRFLHSRFLSGFGFWKTKKSTTQPKSTSCPAHRTHNPTTPHPHPHPWSPFPRARSSSMHSHHFSPAKNSLINCPPLGNSKPPHRPPFPKTTRNVNTNANCCCTCLVTSPRNKGPWISVVRT